MTLTASHRQPPQAPGIPFLGNTLNMRKDVLPYLVGLYQRLGPVFRITIMGREYTVLAGADANRLLAQQGDEYLNSAELFGGYAEEVGAKSMITALDGEPHRHLRKLMRRGFSRETILSQIPQVLALTAEHAHHWTKQESVPMFPAFQKLIVDQLGAMMLNRRPGLDFQPILTMINALLTVKVMKSGPEILLKLPSYRQAKAYSFQIAREILEQERARLAEGDPSAPLLDDLLTGYDPDGNPYDEGTLLNVAIAPYVAGLDTISSTCAFVIYELLKHPELIPAATEEAHKTLSNESLNLRGLKDMHTLYALILETMRLHPVTAILPRNATQDFEFAGYSIKAGANVMIATGVAHYLPEYFPNPAQFDLSRYDETRKEHKQPFVYAPYGLGAHTCLGAGIAEVQMMVTIGALLNQVEMQLDPPDYQLVEYMTPIPSPADKMRVRFRPKQS